MVSCISISTSKSKVLAIYYTPLISIMVMVVVVVAAAAARELRPSDHGLGYQSSPPSGERLPPEMKEFFGSSTAPTSRSSSTGNENVVALPKAMNSNDTAWWDGVVSGKNGSADRLRHVLLVASIACGGTGAALLVVSGFVYFVKYKNKKSATDNSKAIVVVN